MKTNEWPQKISKTSLRDEPGVFPGIAQGQDQGRGDWLLLVKNPPQPQGEGGLNSLAESFFSALLEDELLPATIIFMDNGVRLVCRNSGVLGQILALEQKGVEVFASAACLEYYGLRRELCAGKMLSMAAAVAKISHTLRVVTL